MNNQRGNAMSAFVVLMLVAVIIIGGLAVDGARQVAVQRECEAVAAQAALLGADAQAEARINGSIGPAEARKAAQRHLDSVQFAGSVTVRNDQLIVRTHATVPCIFLSFIGINELQASGSAAATLVGR